MHFALCVINKRSRSFDAETYPAYNSWFPKALELCQEFEGWMALTTNCFP